MEQINNLLVKHLTTGETGFKWENFSNELRNFQMA